MGDRVSVRCTCGQQAAADPAELGQEATCSACGRAFLLWPENTTSAAPQGTWQLKVGQQEMGPFTPADLRKFADLGRIRPDTLVRKGPEAAWVQAAQVKGLLGQPAAAAPPARPPPPLPLQASRAAAPRVGARPSPVPAAGAGRRPLESTSEQRTRAPRSRSGGRGRTRQTSSGDVAAALSRHPLAILALAVGAVGLAAILFGLLGRDESAPDVGPSKTEVAQAKAELEKERADSIAAAKKRAAAKVSAPAQPLSTKEIAARSLKSVAVIRGRHSTGTGFLIGPNLVVTNRHVIGEELMSHVHLQFPDASKRLRGMYGAKLQYEDPELDLAFLQVDIDLPALPLATKHEFVRGEEITVIGSPGLDDGEVVANAISRGLLSTTSEIRGVTYYQLGIAVNPGNSGGPVFDERGGVVGVVTLKATHLEGMAWCLPLASLQESHARAKAASLSEISVMRANHRLEVTVVAVARAGQFYRSAMQLYVSAMKLARLQKQDVNSALGVARSSVASRLRGINGSLMLDLGEEQPKIVTDESLSPAARSRFDSLWANYLEFKNFVDSPRGTFEAYSQKYEALSRERRELLSQMKGLDGIDCGEETR